MKTLLHSIFIWFKRTWFTPAFTPQAEQILSFAQEEARRLNHNYIGTEHVLLGLIKVEEGIAINILRKTGVSCERIRVIVEKLVGHGRLRQPLRQILFQRTGASRKKIRAIVEILFELSHPKKLPRHIRNTPRVNNVLVLARKEARMFKRIQIDTEHVLLALLREDKGIAALVLKRLGMTLEQARIEVLKELDPNIST